MNGKKIHIFDTTLRDGEQVPGCKLNTSEKNATVCELTRAVQKDIEVAAEALKPAQHPRIHTGIGTSAFHIRTKFNSTREDILQRAVQCVKWARNYVPDVECDA